MCRFPVELQLATLNWDLRIEAFTSWVSRDEGNKALNNRIISMLTFRGYLIIIMITLFLRVIGMCLASYKVPSNVFFSS